MSWLVFNYSLPSRNSSSVRVGLWRRLKRIGAVSPKTGVFVLPDREDCLESFQWLAQEIQQSKGEVMVMKVNSFEKLNEKQIIGFFHAARKKDYDELLLEATALRKEVAKARNSGWRGFVEGFVHNQGKVVKARNPGWRDRMEKLRKRFVKINEVDFFRSQHSAKAKKLLGRIEAMLYPCIEGTPVIEKLKIRDYKGLVWVTRPHPYVDRLACVWLIRRFIDDGAKIRYREKPGKNEISFDMKGAVFGHRGNFCSFEVILRSFGIEDEGVRTLAEIIHEIDLRDSKYHRPETEGVELALKGWRRMDLADAEMESRGLSYLDGLYSALASGEKN